MIVIDPKKTPPTVVIDGVAYAPTTDSIEVPAPRNDPPLASQPAPPANPPASGETVVALPGQLPRLRSGQTLLVPSGDYAISLDLLGLHDLTIQWDGKGTKPVLKFDGGGSNMIRFGADSRNITFDGFAINAGSANAFHLGGNGLTFRNIDFIRCNGAFLAEQSVSNVLIDNCRVMSDIAMGNCFLWAGAGGATCKNITVRGCVARNSTRQHIIRLRFGAIANVLIEGNDFANIDRRGQGDPQDSAKTTLFIEQGDGIVVRDNKLTDGNIGIGPLGGPDGANDKDSATAAVSNVTVEGNTITNAVIELYAGVSGVMIANNMLVHDWPDPNAGVGALVSIQGRDYSYNWKRDTSGVTIKGNKGITSTVMARFLAIRGPLKEGVTLRDNTFTAPKMICGAYGVSIISAPSPEAIKESNNNTWPDAKADGWANGGVMNLGPDGSGTGHGFWSKAQWLALPQVKGDKFTSSAGVTHG